MTLEQPAQSAVEAVVVDNGRLLLVAVRNGWGLPSGVSETAETPEGSAARLVYELTGYLVDGSFVLERAEREPTPAAVVCRLLSDTPSVEARLTSDEVRWIPLQEADDTPLPETVAEYLRGRTAV